MNLFRLFNQLKREDAYKGKARLVSNLQGKPEFTEDEVNEVFAYKRMEYHSNPDARKITQKAFASADLGEKFRLLRRLNGVGMTVASTLIMFQNPHRYAEINAHAWNVLKKDFGFKGSDKDGHSDYSVQDYQSYMDALAALADEHGMNVGDVEYTVSQAG
jgi:hypothetical protein